MNRSLPSRSWTIVVLVVIASSSGWLDRRVEAQNQRRRSAEASRRRDPPADDRAAADQLIETLVKRLGTRPSSSSITSVINAYNGVERQSKLSLSSRYRVHRALLMRLGAMEDPAIAKAAARILRTPSASKFAGQVLMMKTLVRESFPASREKRIEWLVRAVEGRHFPLAVWGLRLLGEAGWPEAVDALIQVMEDREGDGDVGGTLWQLASRELYRILGGRTAYSTAGGARAEWKRRDRQVPKEPDYSLGRDEDRARSTAAFFGDRISPRAVFLIDVSGSMKQNVTLRPSGSPSTRTGVEDRGDRGEQLFGKASPKIDVVKDELERAVSALQPSCEFNILKYSDSATPWRAAKGRLELIEATPKNVESAAAFARGLRTDSGTNIFEALDKALQIPEVDTIYLLSDGAPSVGGDVEDIKRNVARRNYLKGARIVTYGFAPERGGGLFANGPFAFDEPFMKELAGTNWGWYRRLNKGAKAVDDERGREGRPRFRRRRPRR